MTIEISEGKYGEITINNKSKLKNSVIENSIRSIKSNEIIESKKLESTLIRLNQIPGIDAKSTLQPGAENGQADLIIDIKDENAINGDLSIDNFGNKDTGTYKVAGSVVLRNPSGIGDQLNLRAMASNLENQYQRIAYQLPTNIGDSKIGFSYSSIQYKVGGASKDLNLSGNVNSQSIFLQQPIISQVDKYADLQIQYEDRVIKDKGDYYGSTIKKQINVLSMTFSGGGVGIMSDRSVSNFSATYSTGRAAVHNPDWDAFYQTSRRFQGVFSKLVINANQTKWFTNKLSIFGQVYAQWADKNLDSSEKIGLGGPYGVRAYSASDDSGDIGFITNIELRHAMMPQTQISAFYDYGKIRLNKNGWGGGNPFIQRAAMGAALEWSSKHGSIKLISALPISPGRSTLAKKAPSVWIQTSYSF
ncbi:ShlB/FhaC/HecB family hemolysin secretion/activation protein [Aquitalea sp. LB_tupeE]|nr:ShlB/FhaC/HecB family hemolysin secretion/activation protein [Aquitalea sp. LB_tupeE]